jgi:hypothetical protein
MEPEVVEFLKKISYTIGLFLLWMILNIIFGIKLQWAYIFDDKIALKNIIFYTACLASFIGTIFLVFKMWRNFKVPH